MSTSGESRRFSEPRTPGRALTLAAAGLGLATAFGLLSTRGSVATAQKADGLQGLGTVTGTVTAGKPFKAAQVYLHSTDKRRPVEYMVYTQAGAFKAVAVFPGNYQVTVKARGLESPPQPLVVKSGDNPAVKVALRDAKTADQYPTSVDPATARGANGALPPAHGGVELGSYEEIYPPGPGRVVLETLCMNCHGENSFPMGPRSAAGWKSALDYMMGKGLMDNEKRGLGEGILAGAASNFRFGLQDRKDVLEYLTKNFGLDKKPRAVRTGDIPVDEAALGKAQFIEYYVVGGKEEGGQPAAAAPRAAGVDSESIATGVAGVRILMQVQIDQDGNRWGVDRGVPSKLTRLDPRTGEIKSWDLPDKRAGVHDMVMDRKGFVWVPEFARSESAGASVDFMGRGSGQSARLLGFNPKTEKWEYTVDPDPDNVVRQANKGPLMGGTVDSKGNVYAHWMVTGAVTRLDIATGKATSFRIPTPGAVPYGECIDPFDNLWVAEWNGGKLGRFNAKTNSWTEFTSPVYPANFRRGPESDAEGNIWVGIWAAGNRPGKMAKLDPKTGNWTLYDIPHRGAQPYEASVDRDGNIWFPDVAEARPDRGALMGRLNPRDSTFTFYPRPQQIADSTRVNHAADGSVHYTARYGSAKDSSAFGVLFPDKDKISTLAPLPLNGLSMVAFKPAPKSTN